MVCKFSGQHYPRRMDSFDVRLKSIQHHPTQCAMHPSYSPCLEHGGLTSQSCKFYLFQGLCKCVLGLCVCILADQHGAQSPILALAYPTACLVRLDTSSQCTPDDQISIYACPYSKHSDEPQQLVQHIAPCAECYYLLIVQPLQSKMSSEKGCPDGGGCCTCHQTLQRTHEFYTGFSTQSKANTNIIPVLEHMASYFPSMLPDPCGLLPHRGGVQAVMWFRQGTIRHVNSHVCIDQWIYSIWLKHT